MRTSDRSNNPTPVMIALLPLLAMLAAILPSVVMDNVNLGTIKTSVVILLLSLIMVFYIRVNADTILNKKLAKTIITLGYLCSISLLLFIPYPEMFSFWMIGGVVVAMLVDPKLGLILHFNLSVLMGIMITQNPENVIQVMIIGMVMSMLSGALLRLSTVIYAAIIILSSNITLAFVLHNFTYSVGFDQDYLKSLFSLSTVIVFAFLFGQLYQAVERIDSTKRSEAVEQLLNAYSVDESDKKQHQDIVMKHDSISNQVIINNQDSINNQNAINNQDAINNHDTINNQDAINNHDMINSQDSQLIYGTRTSYDVLCDLDNELINKMKQHSEVQYQHALHIGDLSQRAALEIGANEKLAFAGGLYHEIGKIRGKNYIEEGLCIAADYSFPNELKAILKEHNIKFEKPSTIEAAIVMLSDSVVSTLEYIEKNDEHKFTTNKVIENIFQLRMDKGTFDATDLSLKDYKKLKEFYQKEFMK